MIGPFRHRVGIEVKTSTATAVGRTDSWTQVGTDWAAVGVLSDRARQQFQQAGNPGASVTLHFRADPRRHDSALKFGFIRFTWNGQILYPVGKIHSLDAQGRTYEVTCESRED